MIRLEFNVPKSRLEDAVAQNTAYTGAKASMGADSDGCYQRVATVDEDGALLERFVGEAFMAAVERLKGFVAEASLADGAAHLVMEMSESYDTGMRGAAEAAFEAYLAAAATARWMRIAMPEKAAEWDAEKDRLLDELVRNLYHRRRPRRRPSPPEPTTNQ